MDFVTLYTKTEGRISRRDWWIGTIILVVINLIIAWFILPILGFTPSPASIQAAAADPDKLNALILGSMQSTGWAGLVVLAIFGWPTYCLGVKRRHDRNNNGVDYLALLGVVALLDIVQGLGLGYGISQVGTVSMPAPSVILMILGLVLLVGGIYLLVQLGFLRGTQGPNQYGPDPLGGTAAATA